MRAIAPAGNGGRGRFMPAALPVRTHRAVQALECVSASVAAAAAALCATLLITGAAMPLVEWFALPERLAEMKHRPKEFGPHFAAFLLALCGLDLVNDLAAVVCKPAGRRTGRSIYVLAVKALMLLALLALSIAAAVSGPQSGSPGTGAIAFVTSEYAGQWGELAVALIGDVLLVAAAHGILLPLPLRERAGVSGTCKDSDGVTSQLGVEGFPLTLTLSRGGERGPDSSP
jgi:hypothetical protein